MRLVISCLLLLVAFLATESFVPSPANGRHSLKKDGVALRMGLFDGLKKAFSNEEFMSPANEIRASARHILVGSVEEAEVVLNDLNNGGNFANLAMEYSTCPSGRQGGALGSFRPGTMVQEFDSVIFNPDTSLGAVVGPVQTKFGYHLIVVDKRTGIE